jgi:hypothetical protein
LNKDEQPALPSVAHGLGVLILFMASSVTRLEGLQKIFPGFAVKLPRVANDIPAISSAVCAHEWPK